MKCELGAALRFVIKSGRELTVAQEIVDSLQAITAKCLKLQLSVTKKKKKNEL